MLSCLSILLLATSVSAQGYYAARGAQIYDPSGNLFMAKGLSLNGYLFPDVGALRLYNDETNDLNSPSQAKKKVDILVGNEAKVKEFWDAFRANFLTEKDLKYIADQGFNAIRLPFNYRQLSQWGSPGEYIKEGFQEIDKVINWAKLHGLGVILDMHACPGGQSHDSMADPEHSYWYWHGELAQWKERGVQVLLEDNPEYTTNTGRSPAFNQQRTADLWREIAKRYAENPTIIGYEIVNEPYWYVGPVNDDTVRAFFMQITDAIREVDKNHMIIVEGNTFAEEINGLLPTWDSNMAIAFHRFWRETGYEDGRVDEYIEARDNYEVPFIMTESGENSNTWMYEMARLMESNQIGWFFKGFKKVDGIAVANEVKSTEDYQYVAANWNEPEEADSDKAYKGLMELTEALKTENCMPEPGYYAALLDPKWNKKSRPYKEHSLPGYIHLSDYDIGNEGVAYSDAKYKQDSWEDGPWNGGWVYRNDGVDIYMSDNYEESNGYHVSGTTAGEWLKYTVDVAEKGDYRVSFRMSAHWGASGKIGEIQLFGGRKFQTPALEVEAAEGGWFTLEVPEVYSLNKGQMTLELLILEGDMKIAWMNFEKLGANGRIENDPGTFEPPGTGTVEPPATGAEDSEGGAAAKGGAAEAPATPEFDFSQLPPEAQGGPPGGGSVGAAPTGTGGRGGRSLLRLSD